MKGRTSTLVILFSLVLVVAHTLVEAKLCCKNTRARNRYHACCLTGESRSTCARVCDCQIISGNQCPSDYPNLLVLALDDKEDGLKDSSTHNVVSTGASTDIILRYCKLGCTSSMCSSMITTPQTLADEEIIRCYKACSDTCTKAASDAGLTI